MRIIFVAHQTEEQWGLESNSGRFRPTLIITATEAQSETFRGGLVNCTVTELLQGLPRTVVSDEILHGCRYSTLLDISQTKGSKRQWQYSKSIERAIERVEKLLNKTVQSVVSAITLGTIGGLRLKSAQFMVSINKYLHLSVLSNVKAVGKRSYMVMQVYTKAKLRLDKSEYVVSLGVCTAK